MMTPRERITKFLNGEPVDRIPNGLGGCETAGLHNLSYKTLKEALGVSDPKNRVCTFMNNAIFEPSVIDAMEGDIILLGTKMCPSRFWGPTADSEWKTLDIWDTTIHVANDWQFRKDPDGTYWWDETSKCPPGELYFDPVPSSEAGEYFNFETPSPDDFNPPHELPEEQLKKLAQDAKFLFENTNYAISCGEIVRDLQLRPGGLTSWWMMMVDNPEACHEFLGKAVDAALAQLKQLDQAIGKYCMMMGLADDIGDQRGVSIGPDLWRMIFKPHYKRLFTEWHKTSNMKVSLHCCGSIVDIMDDLIECGVDILNPVQISADDMNPANLKAKWGDRIIFYGGVFDATLFAPDAPEEEVYAQVKQNIETFSAGGGYMFAGVHNLPGNLPESHIRAMMRAYRDCRDNPALRGTE
ncbi:MAG: hypothetical protein NT018_14520 [Armatimonadetes bacterium]|nr:hypothetical protein [Armatimonadota bacterium]